ncbi:MAG: ATP-binding protein [Myxococcales bacterium]|nr:ATP-binding protein [Myxococcales bacterium]
MVAASHRWRVVADLEVAVTDELLPALGPHQRTSAHLLLRLAFDRWAPPMPVADDRLEVQRMAATRALLDSPDPDNSAVDAARNALQECLAVPGQPVDRLDLAADLLGLSPPARLALGLCACIQLDPRIGQVARAVAARLGYADGADPALVDAALEPAGLGPAWTRTLLHDGGQLRRMGVLTLHDGKVGLSLALQAFLQSALPAHSPLKPFELAHTVPTALLPALVEARRGWIAVLATALQSDRPLLLSGMSGFAGPELVQAAFGSAGPAVRCIDLAAVFDLERGLPTPLLGELHAEVRLSPAPWALFGAERLEKVVREHPAAVRRLVAALVAMGRPVVLLHAGPLSADVGARLAQEAGLPNFELPALPVEARKVLLRAALTMQGVDDPTAEALAVATCNANLEVESVVAAVAFAVQKALQRTAKATAVGKSPSMATPTMTELRAACSATMTSRLRQYGSRVEVLADWTDLVLAEEPLHQVRNLARFARVRDRLFDSWGFGDKLGQGRALSAMFSGPSGTGKTMVAGLIAKDLGVELYRVDLSRVVSKYIGETEERLGALFSEASLVGAALLFDEADSLFGQRTEIKSSNDRYANLEVNYLLQRLEDFDGVVILTTNFATSIDSAFLRRLRFRVQFPMPTSKDRERLWEVLLPSRMPVDDEGIDFEWLGESFDLTGGHIRNAVLRAGMIAADLDRPLSMRMTYDAAAAEYRELGKLAPPYPFDDD